MKKSTVKLSVGTYVKEYNEGTIDFDYPIQRKAGQWTEEDSSLLIHSLVDDYPVPPVYALVIPKQVKDDEGDVHEVATYSILDGKQRLTRIKDFVENVYPIHENTPSVTIMRKKKPVQVDIRGMFFNDLDEDVKDKLLNADIDVTQISHASDEVIESIFFRLNNGQALTKTQKGKSLMGSVWAERFNKVANHKALTTNAQFTPLQKRKADDEIAVIQTMMIMDNLENNVELKSISSNHAFDYLAKFKDNEEYYLPLFNKVVEGLDYINEAFGELQEKFLLKKVHITASIITALHAKASGIAPVRYRDWASEMHKSYLEKGDYIRTQYRKYSGQGTVLGERAIGRAIEMMKHFDTYIGKANDSEKEIEVVLEQAKGDLGIAPSNEGEQSSNESVEIELNEEPVVEEPKNKKAKKQKKEEEEEVQVSLDGILG